MRTAHPWTLNAGYLGQPEESLQAWRNGWFHTGDLMREDPDGWFYFVDRVKDSVGAAARTSPPSRSSAP